MGPVADSRIAGPTRDETVFTPWAQPGWESWDGWSPERDFCRFAGWLQRMLQPAVVIETGVGVGRLTAHLDLGACDYLGFESDPRWRRPPAGGEPSPSDGQLGSADLVVLDSAPTVRRREIARWAAHGKAGSVCVVHDCGNGHPSGHPHHRIRRAVEATRVPGVFLANPRGGWVGIHP